jgi:hypothetical protein
MDTTATQKTPNEAVERIAGGRTPFALADASGRRYRSLWSFGQMRNAIIQRMKALHGIACFVVIVIASGCASTGYSTFEGGKIIQSSGGTKETVDGMDIWNYGSPPRKFRIIGIIDETRRQSLIGMIGYESGLVKKARGAGGDAIVILDAHSEIRGYASSGDSGTATTTGTVTGGYFQGQTTYQSSGSTVTALRAKITKAAVIKFEE